MYVHMRIDEAKVYIYMTNYVFKQNIKQIFSKSYILARFLQTLRQFKTFVNIIQNEFSLKN